MNVFKSIFATFALLIMLCTAGYAQFSPAQKEEKTSITRTEYQPETIQKAQQALKEKGFYKGEVSGKMDTNTRDAIKAFQAQQGIRETGRLNKETRQRLGIEATTAGAVKKPEKRAVK